MKFPQSSSKEGETRVYRLRKSLYGLKQASHSRYQKFTMAILDLGFRQCCDFQGCRPSSFPIEPNLKLDNGETELKVDSSRYMRMVGSHLETAQCVLRYHKATPRQRVLLLNDVGYNLTVYYDSNWLGCLFTRRSHTSCNLLLGGAPISWNTKKYVISCSSTEAEYRLMASTISEVLWMRWLLSELEHVEIDCYFIHERVESKEVSVFPLIQRCK
ncbi:uncharacterized mitochondrial protein-like protein [Tanacetum coccineum]